MKELKDIILAWIARKQIILSQSSVDDLAEQFEKFIDRTYEEKECEVDEEDKINYTPKKESKPNKRVIEDIIEEWYMIHYMNTGMTHNNINKLNEMIYNVVKGEGE